jgi:hypothetical protein
MNATPGKWQIFEAETPVLTCAYSFGPGIANALAVGAPAGLFVFSPPYRPDATVLDGLRSFGPVAALVATNAFHHMGLPEWARQFPEAAVFAPAQSVARVSRKARLGHVRPVSEAQTLAGPHLEMMDMPHYRTGEVLACIDTARGRAWYVTDVISNMPELPRHPLVRLAYALSASAPGLKFNNFAALFMLRDKRALKCWLAAEYRRAPPRWLIPAHGEIADLGEAGAALAAVFEA